MKQFLIGSYAPEGEPSIFGVELDEEKQKLRLLWEDGQVQTPSFLYLHPNCHVLYAVEERVPNGGLAVMIKTEEGWLLKERLLAGSAPCHLEMTPDARYLLVSNYMDGTIGVYRADESGMNVVQTDLVRHQGKGVNPTRQEGPHVHSCLVIGEKIYSADLGLDTIFVYEFNPADGKLEECAQIHMPDAAFVIWRINPVRRICMPMRKWAAMFSLSTCGMGRSNKRIGSYRRIFQKRSERAPSKSAKDMSA